MEDFRTYLLKGLDYYNKADFKPAFDILTDALPTIEQSAQADQLVKFTDMIANCCLNLGNFDEAIIYLKKSLATYELMGDKKGQANTLSKIANSLIADGKNGIEFLDRSTEIYRELSDHAGVASNQLSFAGILAENKDYKEALEMYEECILFFESLKDDSNFITTLSAVVDIYLELDRLDNAEEAVRRILKLGREEDNKLAMAVGMVGLGKLALKGKLERPPPEMLAAEHFKKGIEYMEELDMPFFTMELSYKVGMIILSFEYSQGYKYLRKSLDYAIQLDNTEYISLCNLAIDKIPQNVRDLFR